MERNWPIATRLFWKIRDIHHMQRNLAFHQLAEKGLHFGQPRMLHTIDRMEGATQKEIAEALHTTPASFATSVKRMEKAGLVAKITDKKDLRRNSVQLTEMGRALMNDATEAFQERDRRMMDGFSEEELLQLASFLERIAANIDAMTPEGLEPIHPVHPRAKAPLTPDTTAQSGKRRTGGRKTRNGGQP